MKNEFNFKRFGMFLKTELSRNYKKYLLIYLIFLGIYLLAALFNGIDGMKNSISTLISFTGVITFFFPFILYPHLFHGVKGVAPALLPASQTEKFLACMLQCVVFFPFSAFLFIWILSLAGSGITGLSSLMMDWRPFFCSSSRWGFFDADLWSMISSQAICIWGIFFFKNGKLWKTLLTICCAGILLSIFGLFGVCMSVGYHPNGGFFTISDPDHAVLHRVKIVLNILFGILLPIGLWLWGYAKMRRQQF